MISADEERYILANAYVPEHTVGMMALISGGEPFLIDDYLCFAQNNWVILVGYPITAPFATTELEGVIGRATKTFRPEYLWFIAPEVPPGLVHVCRERESDAYYTLELQRFELKAPLRRIVNRALRDLRVERDMGMGKSHQDVIAEFLEREKPGPRIERLFLSMAGYTARSTTATLLTARDREGDVSAFYVVELGARTFVTYVVGCHSRKHYVSGASDLVFLDMVRLAGERGKDYIHLGLGVNEGIRRFKEKWGGTPFLPYEFCGCRRGVPPFLRPFLSRAWS